MAKLRRLEGKAAKKLESIVKSLDRSNLPAAAQTAKTLLTLVKDEDTLFAHMPSSGHRRKLRKALSQAAGS